MAAFKDILHQYNLYIIAFKDISLINFIIFMYLYQIIDKIKKNFKIIYFIIWLYTLFYILFHHLIHCYVRN